VSAPGTPALPPFATPDAAEFWAGCALGELRLQQCGSCGAWQFYPRPFCTTCDGRQLAWRRAAGTGTLRSYSVVRRPVDPAWSAEAPYLLALVRLYEGPTLMTALQDCRAEQARIGMKVEVTFDARPGGFVLPRFRPLA
jgi:uncharacterized OB-fold protein